MNGAYGECRSGLRVVGFGRVYYNDFFCFCFVVCFLFCFLFFVVYYGVGYESGFIYYGVR